MNAFGPPVVRRKARRSTQTSLFDQPAAPDGFAYRADLLTPAEEVALVRELANLPFAPFDFHGHLANRQVVGFGSRYDYAAREVRPAPPIPGFLLPLREKIADFAGHPAAAFEQVLINHYPPGAGIGWHRDRAQFEDVVGVSLLAPCVMRFRRKAGERWDRLSVPVEPRSAYRLSGPSRHAWEHSIAPMIASRYSITFRTLAAQPSRRINPDSRNP